MKILVLDEEFPYPLNTGKRTRSFNLYSRMTSHFHIRYVAYGEDGPAGEALRSVGIETVAVKAKIPAKQGAAFYLRLLANLLSRHPYIVTSHFSRAYLRTVINNLEEYRPDLIICEWTPYTIYVKDITSIKKLVSTHNIEADIWQRYYENETNALRRWYIREQWRKVSKFERISMGWVNGAIAVSKLDSERLAQYVPQLPVEVVPNGVDFEYFYDASQPENRQTVVFTGSMDWRPNQDAVQYFVREIFPLLKKLKSDVQSVFVGRSPPPDIQALNNIDGIIITGTVDDVRPYIEKAAVYIVPLRVGGGSRLKILEALAMGRAVVSTTVGAEGLDVVHGRHLLLADDGRSFADSVIRLLNDPKKCGELGNKGRRLVEESYGWDSLAHRFEKYVHRITEEVPDTKAIEDRSGRRSES